MVAPKNSASSFAVRIFLTSPVFPSNGIPDINSLKNDPSRTLGVRRLFTLSNEGAAAFPSRQRPKPSAQPFHSQPPHLEFQNEYIGGSPGGRVFHRLCTHNH